MIPVSGRFTHYSPGLGACGQTHTSNDFVVALNHVDFDPQTPNGNPALPSARQWMCRQHLGQPTPQDPEEEDPIDAVEFHRRSRQRANPPTTRGPGIGQTT